MNAVSADKTPTAHPPPPSECKIYQSEVEELTDLMPTTISMQAADRKFFSQNDLSQPSVLAFCHICSTASNRNNISNTSLCLAKAQGKCRHTQVKETQLCVICATRPQKVVICATRPQKVPRFVTTPNKLQRLILILFSFLFFCCGFCCCLGFCCCCCGGKGGGFFLCVWSFFFFCLVYLANIYATKCWYKWVNLFTIKSNKEQNKNVSLF